MGKFEPGDTKAWLIVLDGGSGMWVDDAKAVASECTDWDDEPMLVQKQVKCIKPGHTLKAACEDREWTVTCQTVDKTWLKNLPEHVGW